MEACALLLELPEGYCSHRFRKLFFCNILYYLEQSAGFPEQRKETFASTCHQGRTTWTNQRVDYWCRGVELLDLCLYEYVLRVEEWTQAAAARASLHGCQYDESHPRTDSHCQVITGYELIPCLVGPSTPPLGRADGKHERIALVLFKPHVRAEYLLPEQQDDGTYDWATAYKELYEQSTLRIRHWLSKMDLLSQTESAKEKPIGEQEHSLDELHPEEEDNELREEDVEQAANEAAAFDAMTAVDVMNMGFRDQANEEVVGACNIAAHQQHIDANLGRTNTVWDTKKQQVAVEATSALMQMCTSARTGDNYPDQTGFEVAGCVENPAGPPPAEVVELPKLDELVASVSRKFGLNEEQDLALRVVAKAFDGRSPAVRVFVPGNAGTGKTRVVLALTDLATQLHAKIATSCPTGVAADLIDGSTMHQMFAIFKTKQTPNLRRELRAQFERVSLFIIDEISMVGGNLLGKVDSVLRWVFNPDECFGGKSFVFMGDFLQLPCVLDTPLFTC